MTDDGILTDEEISELRTWLETNRSSDLPAIPFLVETVERILADGIVTTEERKELYSAIEKVLPPEARREATTQRRAVEAEEKQRGREQRDAVRQQQDAEKQLRIEENDRQRPLQRANFMVAGVHYEGRPEVIREYAQEFDTVYVKRDTQNKFSRNAIEVLLQNGMQIGFVPEDDAPDLAPLLDKGCPHVAYITKMLTGGRVPIPVVQVCIYRVDATEVESLAFPQNVPIKQRNSALKLKRGEEVARKGCGLLLVALVGCGVLLLSRLL